MALSMTVPAGAPLFLARCGWAGAAVAPLAGDASFRRYFRVEGAGRRAVLMDAPPPHEDPRPFLRVARYLAERGFRAPAIVGEDLEEGLVLLEDFGDARMREVLDAAPAREEEIYGDCVALLARLHAIEPADVPDYGVAELQREAGLLTEWFAPAAGLAVDAEGYRAAWAPLFAQVTGGRRVTVLRDYHAENVMLLEDGALGLLDFQDALAGHPAYDLVSLLQDARRDVSADVEAAMLDRYEALTGQRHDEAYAILGAQRNTKIVGIFTRLWKRDGKPRYLDYLPRVWRYLERDLEHPALAEVKTWFDANLPRDRRLLTVS